QRRPEAFKSGESRSYSASRSPDFGREDCLPGKWKKHLRFAGGRRTDPKARRPRESGPAGRPAAAMAAPESTRATAHPTEILWVCQLARRAQEDFPEGWRR